MLRTPRRRTVGPGINQQGHPKIIHGTSYIDTAVLEPFSKDLLYDTFMFAFDDSRGGGKYSECALTHTGIIGLAGLEQRSEEFHPGFAYFPEVSANGAQQETRSESYRCRHIPGQSLQRRLKFYFSRR